MKTQESTDWSEDDFIKNNSKSFEEMHDYGSFTKDFTQRLKNWISSHTQKVRQEEREKIRQILKQHFEDHENEAQKLLEKGIYTTGVSKNDILSALSQEE